MNTSGIKVTWEEALAKFDNLIKFASAQHVQGYTLDNMYKADDLYQEGMIKLYDCWMKWCCDPEVNKGMDEFEPIFKKSLFRAVRKGHIKKQDYSGNAVEFIDLENSPVESIVDEDFEGDPVEKIFRQEAISQLKSTLKSDLSRRILDELLEPSEKTMWEVWADTARRATLRSQGKKINVPTDNTVRAKHIIRALGVSTKQFETSMSEIRQHARIALEL